MCGTTLRTLTQITLQTRKNCISTACWNTRRFAFAKHLRESAKLPLENPASLSHAGRQARRERKSRCLARKKSTAEPSPANGGLRNFQKF
jgi:hypothetical protein